MPDLLAVHHRELRSGHAMIDAHEHTGVQRLRGGLTWVPVAHPAAWSRLFWRCCGMMTGG